MRKHSERIDTPRSVLHPSSKGKRVRISGDQRRVIDRPFTETKQLVAGYWIWQVKSMEEALEWVRRCPPPMPGEESEIEIRPVFEADDFGQELTPELRAQESASLRRWSVSGRDGSPATLALLQAGAWSKPSSRVLDNADLSARHANAM